MINIAIIGACMTRDNFNRKYNPNYSRIYNCVSTAWHASLVGFMSNPMPNELKTLVDYSDSTIPTNVLNHRTVNLERDLNKSYRSEMIESQPDYLILDLYTDVQYGILKIKDTYLTNSPATIRKTSLYRDKKYDKILNFRSSSDYTEFSRIFKESFSDLILWMNTFLPNTKLILHKFNYSHTYIDDKFNIQNFPLEKFKYIDSVNLLYNDLYDYIDNNSEVMVIDMRGKNYLCDGSENASLTPWHYTIQYKNDFLAKLNEVCLEDIINNKNTSL